MYKKINIFFIYCIFSILIKVITSNNSDAEYSEINFKVLPEYTSVQFAAYIDSTQLNMSININSDKNLLFGPKNKFMKKYISKEKIDIKTPRNILYSDLQSYLIKKEIKIKDSFSNTYECELPINYIIDTKMKNIANKHSPMPHFGFARIFKDESNSLVHKLYKSGYISKRQFSIEYFYPHWGTLRIGNTLEKFENMRASSLRCINTQNSIINSNWGVYLQGIFFGNYINKTSNDEVFTIDPIKSRALELKMPMYLSSEYENIVVPFDVIKYFQDYYFNELIENKSCRLEEDKDKIYFRCRESAYEKLENVHFLFDDNIDLLVQGKNLVDQKGRFKIVYIKNYRREYILGYFFMKNFKIIFDYDEDTVSFYSTINKLIIKDFEYPNSIYVSTEYENEAYINRIYSDYHNEKNKKITLYEHSIIKKIIICIIIMLFGALIMFFVKYIRTIKNTADKIRKNNKQIRN